MFLSLHAENVIEIENYGIFFCVSLNSLIPPFVVLLIGRLVFNLNCIRPILCWACHCLLATAHTWFGSDNHDHCRSAQAFLRSIHVLQLWCCWFFNSLKVNEHLKIISQVPSYHWERYLEPQFRWDFYTKLISFISIQRDSMKSVLEQWRNTFLSLSTFLGIAYFKDSFRLLAVVYCYLVHFHRNTLASHLCELFACHVSGVCEFSLVILVRCCTRINEWNFFLSGFNFHVKCFRKKKPTVYISFLWLISINFSNSCPNSIQSFNLKTINRLFLLCITAWDLQAMNVLLTMTRLSGKKMSNKKVLSIVQKSINNAWSITSKFRLHIVLGVWRAITNSWLKKIFHVFFFVILC